MERGCQQLKPLPPCGFHGSCQLVDESVNSSALMIQLLSLLPFKENCVCEPGWSQTKEMSFYFLTEDEFEAGISMCSYNESILMSLYSFALVVSVLGFLNQLARVIRMGHFDRLAFFVVGLLLSIFLCIYRLFYFDSVVYGADFVFTFGVAQIGALALLSSAYFVNRYIKYLATKVHFTNPKALAFYKVFKSLEKPCAAVDIIIMQLGWIGLVTSNLRGIGRILLNIAMGYASLRMLYTGIVSRIVLTAFLNDMRLLLESQQSISTSGRMFKVEKTSEGFKHSPSDSGIRLRKKFIPQTKRMRTIFGITCFLVFICFMLPTIWPFMLLQLGYIIPFTFTLFALPNFGGLKVKKVSKAKTTEEGVNYPLTSPLDLTTSIIESVQGGGFDSEDNLNSKPTSSSPNEDLSL